MGMSLVPDTRSASVKASLGPADNAPAAAVTQHGHGIINIWILTVYLCMCFNRFKYIF